MKVLMISGDKDLVLGKEGPFSITMTGLSKYWNQIVVLCPGVGEHKREFLPNVTLLGTTRANSFKTLSELLSNGKFDLVITHDYGIMFNGLLALVAHIKYKIPYISEIHHLEGFPIHATFKEFCYQLWGKIYLRIIRRFCLAVRIVNKQDIYRLLRKIGYPEEQVLYLASSNLNLSLYQEKVIEKKFDILFVGRFSENKGIFVILRALLKLKENGLKFKACLKGRGALLSKAQTFIRENNLEDYVSLNTDILSEEQLCDLYNQSRMLICASTVEGGPRVTLEAMACSTPVITTKCGIMPEVIEHSQSGLFFDGTTDDLVSKIETLLGDSDLYLKIKENSHQAVSELGAEKLLREYAAGYSQIIKSLQSR